MELALKIIVLYSDEV